MEGMPDFMFGDFAPHFGLPGGPMPGKYQRMPLYPGPDPMMRPPAFAPSTPRFLHD